jgi:hypothetical protein
MKKFSILMLAVLVGVLSSGCASTGTPAPGSTGAAAIAIGKAGLRIGITLALQTQGVSPEITTAVLDDVEKIIDGKGLASILDPDLWQTARAELVTEIAGALAKRTTVNGVALIDQRTAEALLGPLVDSFAMAVRRAHT